MSHEGLSLIHCCLERFAFSFFYFMFFKKITGFSGGKNGFLFHYKNLSNFPILPP